MSAANWGTFQFSVKAIKCHKHHQDQHRAGTSITNYPYFSFKRNHDWPGVRNVPTPETSARATKYEAPWVSFLALRPQSFQLNPTTARQSDWTQHQRLNVPFHSGDKSQKSASVDVCFPAAMEGARHHRVSCRFTSAAPPKAIFLFLWNLFSFLSVDLYCDHYQWRVWQLESVAAAQIHSNCSRVRLRCVWTSKSISISSYDALQKRAKKKKKNVLQTEV